MGVMPARNRNHRQSSKERIFCIIARYGLSPATHAFWAEMKYVLEGRGVSGSSTTLPT